MTHGEYRQSFLSYNPSQLLHLIPQPGREVAVAELPEGGTIVVISSQLAVSRKEQGTFIRSFIQLEFVGGVQHTIIISHLGYGPVLTSSQPERFGKKAKSRPQAPPR